MTKEELKTYALAELKAGKTSEALYLELLPKGISVPDIEEALKGARVPEMTAVESQQRTITIVLAIASVLVGAGVFSFIASNWGYLGKPSKVAIIIVWVVVFHVLAYFMKERWGRPRVADALHIVGTLSFGAGIFLLGQIFNASTQWPDGFIIWMFGSLLMAAAVKSMAHYGIAIAVGFVAILTEPMHWFDQPLGYSPIITTAGILLLLAAGVTATAGLLLRKRTVIPNQELY